MEWLFFSIIVVILAYLDGKYKDVNTYIRILLAVCMAYVVGFGGIGFMDHDGYVRIYENTRFGQFEDYSFSFGRIDSRANASFEWGYIGLNYLAHFLQFGEAGFFCLVAFITNYLLLLLILDYSKHPIFSCLLFILSHFFMQEPNLVRQTLAASVVLYAIQYIHDEKWWKYVGLIIVASLFHISAVFLIVLFFLRYVDYNKNRGVILTILVVLWLISLLFLYDFLQSDFLGLSNIFFNIRNGITVTNIETSRDAINSTVLHNIMNSLVLLSFVYFFLIKTKAKINAISILFFLGPIFYNLGENNYGMSRFSYYFLPLMVIVIPNLLYGFKFGKRDKTHAFYYIYCFWNIYILIKTRILSDTPLFFNKTYNLGDFFT